MSCYPCSVRSKTSKMATDTETRLRRLFQNPLQDFEQWKPSVHMLLDSPEPALAHIEVASLLLDSETDIWFVCPSYVSSCLCIHLLDSSSWKGLSSMAENPTEWRSILSSSCSRMSCIISALHLVNWSCQLSFLLN